MGEYFDYSENPGPQSSNHLKCLNCGHEAEIRRNVPYEEQADCPSCKRGQMMSWNWGGWKLTPESQLRLRQETRRQKEARLIPVPQESESFDGFTPQERNIHDLLVVEKPGTEAPWLTPFGASLVKIFGIRRRNNRVEFGIGNRRRPIRAWVTADRFLEEWPQ